MNKRSGRVTVKDIAKAVGVSATAVSMALNNRGSLTDARREEIKLAAASMGYVPNVGARALRGCSTQSFGIVINYFSNPFFNDFFAGVEDVVNPIGFSYWVSQSRDKLAQEQAQVRKLAQLGVDGIILLPCSKETAHLQEISEQFNIPIVLINHQVDIPYPAVVVDNISGARQATEHLLSEPGRRVLHVAGPIDDKRGIYERYLGYCQTMQERVNDFNPQDNVFFVERLTMEDGYRVMDEILKRCPLPLSIFAVNDEVALGMLTCCSHRNLRMPEDVALVGFSDVDILESLNIPLSTVAMQRSEMGRQAAELLLRQIKQEIRRDQVPVITLPVSLVIRGTSKKL
jgi:LacI family transcriptional regulator